MFLSYVVPGFLFFAVFRYILYKDKNIHSQAAYTLLKSIVCSFVLKVVVDGVLNVVAPTLETEFPNTYFVILMLLGVITGYLSSVLSRKECIKKALLNLGVNRTVNDNIWDDIIIPGLWLRVWTKSSEGSYLGQIKYVENYEREPIVVLEYYQHLDSEYNILEDYTDNPGFTIMVNLKEFERIEITEDRDIEEKRSLVTHTKAK